MTFGDKITKLRKKEGLSQEELGEKLNVTRQTISKWELNQTIPDINKLKEISNLFNVSIESLTSEDEPEKKENIKKEITNNNDLKPRKWLLIILIILSIIISIILLDKVITMRSEKINNGKGIINTIKEKVTEIFNNDFDKKFKVDSFNSTFEMHQGTKNGYFINNLLDDIITNNKKNEEKRITLSYKDTKTSDPEEIKNIKKSFDQWTKYEVSLDYDKEGYVYLITIEDIETKKNESEQEIKQKPEENNNQKYEIYQNNVNYGVAIKNMLKNVISDNDKKTHIISVIFNNETAITDTRAINDILQNIKDWNKYSVSVGYDQSKYVNSISIKEV